MTQSLENEINEVTQPDLQRTGFGYTLKLIGGKYKITILYLLSLSETPLRYNQLKRLMKTISYKSLTNALNALTNDGLITRKQYPEIPPRVEYGLTALGQTLVPVLDVMCDWGEDRLRAEADQ